MSGIKLAVHLCRRAGARVRGEHSHGGGYEPILPYLNRLKVRHLTMEFSASQAAGDMADKLRGATLDLPSNKDQGGLVLRNPNRPNPLAGQFPQKTKPWAEGGMAIISWNYACAHCRNAGARLSFAADTAC